MKFLEILGKWGILMEIIDFPLISRFWRAQAPGPSIWPYENNCFVKAREIVEIIDFLVFS